MDLTHFGEYGLVGLMIGAIIFLLFKVIVWTLATTREILNQAAKERETLHGIIEKHNSTLEKINQSIDRHDEKADARGAFVREEHKEMIDVLKRINGYKTKD